MATPTGPDAGRYRNAEAALGGADAVPDTPDIAAHGTEPGWDGADRRTEKRGSPPLARVSPGGGPPAVVWIGGVLALLVLIAVGFGIFA